MIRHAKRLDGLSLPDFNPLVLVHSEVLAAIQAQSARLAHGRLGGVLSSVAAGQGEGRTLSNLGVGSLVRLALHLQAAIQHKPYTEWFGPLDPNAF